MGRSHRMKSVLSKQKTRAYIYRVALAVLGIAALYGLVGPAEVEGITTLVESVLAISVVGMAARNTSTKED
jgi:hypothetical protein